MKSETMTHMLAQAIGQTNEPAGMDEALTFARQFATMLDYHEDGAPNPDDVVEATRVFLTLRTRWNEGEPDWVVRWETMGAIQQALSALGYELDLDDTEIDFHTPDDDGTIPDRQVEALIHSGFEDAGTLGVLTAATWHAIGGLIAGGKIRSLDVGQLRELHAFIRTKGVQRIITGSFDLDDQSLGELVDLMTRTAEDHFALTPAAAMPTVSKHLRDIFGIAEEAAAIERAISTEGSGDKKEGKALRHAAATVAAIGGCDPLVAATYVMELANGSVTGLPHVFSIPTLGKFTLSIQDLIYAEDDQDNLVADAAITTAMAAMTLVGRVPPMDDHRMKSVVKLVEEDLRQNLDEEDEPMIVLEKLDSAIRRNAETVDEFLQFAEAVEVDDDAVAVRVAMDRADPSPPPAGDQRILPRALLIRTEDDIDIGALQHRINAFLVPQPDSFRAFAHGDIYWRLAIAGENDYSATVSALRTIAALPGVAQASIVHRGFKGIGVTTVHKDGKPVHRTVRAAETQDD